MIRYTERLVLRRWEEEDAQCLYELAKDPRVGPLAGWPPHSSVENSKKIIQDVLSVPLTFAVALKEKPDKVIGSIGIMLNSEEIRFPFMDQKDAEIGFWLGVPYWGKGYVPEAVKSLLLYCFEDLLLENIWCGYYEGNDKSKRVQEKLGFAYSRTEKQLYVPLFDEYRDEHFTKISKDQWKRDQVRE